MKDKILGWSFVIAGLVIGVFGGRYFIRTNLFASIICIAIGCILSGIGIWIYLNTFDWKEKPLI